MKKGILGKKEGMTSVFTKNGILVPVTVISVEPNVVMQIKSVEKDGYDAIQMGYGNKREKISNKPEMGHAKKANTTPKRFLKEIRGVDVSNYQVGQEIKANLFEAGEVVDVTGVSKGKGFQGVIKRYNQTRGPMGHGSQYHRGVGSLGSRLPMHVLKGKKLPGHMGFETVTIQNLEIVEVDTENNLLLVKGNVPGPKKSMIIIRSSVKNPDEIRETLDLIKYNNEELLEENNETQENVEVVEESSQGIEQ
ncbi:MAG: 50S ribosomal protein L3 [Tenericutes bacterium]|jgi:large subunit ribosomal protein L3|nr:50S ribosomal protein L3 [Mycoplasmatota bacterium]